MLAEIDVLTINAPYSRETHHMIDARRLAQMKPDAYLINAARGGHLVEDNRLDYNTYRAISVRGDGTTVRRNLVFDTYFGVKVGGTAAGANCGTPIAMRNVASSSTSTACTPAGLSRRKPARSNPRPSSCTSNTSSAIDSQIRAAILFSKASAGLAMRTASASTLAAAVPSAADAT